MNWKQESRNPQIGRGIGDLREIRDENPGDSGSEAMDHEVEPRIYANLREWERRLGTMR